MVGSCFLQAFPTIPLLAYSKVLFPDPLTLILPGEVKVALANFDVKFWTKLLYLGFFEVDLFLKKCLPNILNF
jgi:hypothetical protein